MSERPVLNEREARAREALVGLAAAMLDGSLSFFEGAVEVLRLKSAVGGVADRDPHFDVFAVIESETDHLPLKAQQQVWNAKALAGLQPEFERTERWAASFAPAACHGLIERFARPAKS
jgi:hypothetical protein